MKTNVILIEGGLEVLAKDFVGAKTFQVAGQGNHPIYIVGNEVIVTKWEAVVVTGYTENKDPLYEVRQITPNTDLGSLITDKKETLVGVMASGLFSDGFEYKSAKPAHLTEINIGYYNIGNGYFGVTVPNCDLSVKTGYALVQATNNLDHPKE